MTHMFKDTIVYYQNRPVVLVDSNKDVTTIRFFGGGELEVPSSEVSGHPDLNALPAMKDP